MQRFVVMISEIPQWRDVKINSLSRLALFRLNASTSEIRSSRGQPSLLLSFIVTHYLLHDTFVPLTVQMHLRQPHQLPSVSGNRGKSHTPSPPGHVLAQNKGSTPPLTFFGTTDSLEKTRKGKVSLSYRKKLFF